MILQYLDQLADTTKRNEKVQILESILRDSKYADMFKRVVFMAYDPSLNFWVREFQPSYVNDGSKTLTEALDHLEQEVASRNITGNQAIRELEDMHGLLGEDDAEVFARVIKRDLRCGVGAKTFNKVFPGLIYVHPYMRCESFKAKNLKNVKFPCYSQVKMDGLYVDVIVKDGTVTYMSRNGKVLDFNHPDTDPKFQDMSEGVYMGEAVALDENGYIMSRSKSNGYLNSDDIDPARLIFFLWDVVSTVAFCMKHSTTEYDTRFADLKQQVEENPVPKVNVVESRMCVNPEEVKQHAMDAVARGEEGTVIKDRSMDWKDGTNKLSVKIKPDFEVDLKVVDYKMGKGRNEGVLGALVCRTSDDLLEVSVGTGYSDKDRQTFLQAVESMVSEGTVVTVKANDIITNESKPDMYSLFLPRFIKVRKDKNEADSLDRVNDQKESYTEALNLIGS